MRTHAGKLVLESDAAGAIVAVAPHRTPDRPYLVAVDLGPVLLAGGDRDPIGAGEAPSDRSRPAAEIEVDADELTVRRRVADLEVTLRHGFSTGWTTRLLLVNTGTTELVLERLPLRVRPAVGHRVTAQTAGARLCWAVQADDGRGPVLAARLAAGAVNRVTADGLELGPLRLAPGRRWVAQLRWELYATARSVVVGPGRDVLVDRTTYEVGEGALLPEDPDAALVVPPALAVDLVEEPERAGREVVADEPGRHRVELRSAEGDIRLDLTWVLPLADQLTVWASEILAGRRTPAGVVAIDVAGALVLQASLGGGGEVDIEQAADALDRLTARLIDDGDEERARDASPLEVLYLLGEHGRTGDDDVLAAALEREGRLLAADGPPPPGLGLAVLRTVLAVGGGDHRLAPVLSRAVARVTAATGPVSALRPAELELLLAVRPLLPPGPAAGAGPTTRQRLLDHVRALGAALGSGLPGRLLQPPPTADHAHLVAVLRMLPEQAASDEQLSAVTRSWGAPPGLLAHRATLEVLDRLVSGRPAGAGTADERLIGSATPDAQLVKTDAQLVGPNLTAAAWLSLVPRLG